jgi:D-alanine-D-alanine ligase
MKVAVIYNEPVKGKPDSEDVLDEVDFVVRLLSELGHSHKLFPIRCVSGKTESNPGGTKQPSSSLNEVVFYLMFQLKKYKPDAIFNLVEGVNDDPTYQQFFVLLFEHLGYPFTGSGYSAMLSTSDKSVAKMLMNGFNIPTPGYDEYRGINKGLTGRPPWIVKPALEDASIGIDETSVYHNKKIMMNALHRVYERHGRQTLIIEQYINGREFNVSLLERPGGQVEVLPVAEIVFNEWPENKPMIVGYSAKWDKKSFEYRHTERRFHPSDVKLDVIERMALKCWKVFRLNGYARVDIRLAEDNTPYVLEINANPCISPDSGFIAAVRESGNPESYFVSTVLEVSMR